MYKKCVYIGEGIFELTIAMDVIRSHKTLFLLSK